jgi:hypothetical protein
MSRTLIVTLIYHRHKPIYLNSSRLQKNECYPPHASRILPASNTNITAFHVGEVMALILLEYMNWSSWDLIRVSFHWVHLNVVFHVCLPPAIPTLQPFELCCPIDFVTHTYTYTKSLCFNWYSDCSEWKWSDYFFPNLIVLLDNNQLNNSPTLILYFSSFTVPQAERESSSVFNKPLNRYISDDPQSWR